MFNMYRMSAFKIEVVDFNSILIELILFRFYSILIEVVDFNNHSSGYNILPTVPF